MNGVSYKILSGLIFTTLAITLRHYFQEQYGLDFLISASIAILITTFLYILIDPFISHFPRSFTILRKKYDKRAAIEGFWLEKMKNQIGEYYSIIEVKYSRRKDGYTLIGDHFDKNGKHIRKFTGKKVFIEESHDSVLYWC